MATIRKSLEDTIEDAGQSPVEKYTGIIAAYDREFKKWDSRVDRLLKRYRDELRGNRDSSAKFNVLWSNVQTLVPAVFAKIPKPDVSRRFRDNDPIGRVAALILERALEYEAEHYPDFYRTTRQCVTDRFLGGRGTAWVRYEPHIRAGSLGEPVDGVQISEDVDEPQEELDYECSPVDYVHWKDFGHSVARTWEEVTQVWRRVFLTEDQVEERFGEEIAKKVPMDARPDQIRKTDRAEMGGDGEGLARAEVYEVWDKTEKKVYWISKSVAEPLDVKDDPLGLEEFWPCPRPLYATLTNETLVPVPDFTMYQDQARELDTLADRIDGLIIALQVRGVYDAAIPEISRIFTEGQNTNLIPVKNWAAFAEKNGLDGAMDIVDLKPIYEALRGAYEAMSQVLQQIYDLTGISDIIRGQSNANETATAQQIKGQYASLRLKALQYEVAFFCSQMLQLKAQVICGQFDPKTMMTMAGVEQLSPEDQQLVPQAMALLIGPERMQDPAAKQGPNLMRNFRIEVNADTMVQADEEEEKAKRLEFISAVGGFFEKTLPLVQQVPQAAPIAVTLLKFGITAFKVGKSVEGALDQAIDQLTKAAAQPQPPKQDPEVLRVQADSQIQQARIAAEKETNLMKLQADQQAEAARMQAESQREAQQQALENQRHQRELQASAAEKQREMQVQQETELRKTALQVAGQIEVARINADAKADADARALHEANETAAEEAAEHTAEQAGIDTNQIMQQLLETQSRLLETMSAPKQIMRDDAGRVIGMQVVK